MVSGCKETDVVVGADQSQDADLKVVEVEDSLAPKPAACAVSVAELLPALLACLVAGLAVAWLVPVPA